MERFAMTLPVCFSVGVFSAQVGRVRALCIVCVYVCVCLCVCVRVCLFVVFPPLSLCVSCFFVCLWVCISPILL
jgi:hypothetical protein